MSTVMITGRRVAAGLEEGRPPRQSAGIVERLPFFTICFSGNP